VPAEIAHLEDEPPDVFHEITTTGLKLGLTIEILDRTDHEIVVWDGVREYLIPARAAGNVFVRSARRPRVPTARLSDLLPGESATVTDLECEGFGRRRLLDLGVTPGTRVDCLFAGLAPEPMAYRIRGAVIALRREQAAEILVDRTTSRTPDTPPASATTDARI
jgi:DtxR family Mn-dependent transcriptional regulator